MERPFQDLDLSIPTLKNIPWFFLSSRPLFHGNQRNSTTLKLERQLSKSWSESSIGTLRWPGIQVRPERGGHRELRVATGHASVPIRKKMETASAFPARFYSTPTNLTGLRERWVIKVEKHFGRRLGKRWNALTLSHQHLRQLKRKKTSTFMAADFWELVWQSGRIW